MYNYYPQFSKILLLTNLDPISPVWMKVFQMFLLLPVKKKILTFDEIRTKTEKQQNMNQIHKQGFIFDLFSLHVINVQPLKWCST